MAVDKRSYLTPVASGLLIALAVAILVYSDRSHLSSWKLGSDQSRMWEIIFKAVAGFLGILAALVAALKYIDDKVHATEVARREARKEFSSKQQDVYFRLINATSMIGNEVIGTADRVSAEKAFWRIYWGEIVMVEDPNVAVSVDAFSDALWDVPGNSVRLLNLSMNVARACRDSLGDTWKVEQDDLPESSLVKQQKSTPALVAANQSPKNPST
jgi:hypothetical protein